MFVIRSRSGYCLELDQHGYFRWQADLQSATRFNSFGDFVKFVVKAVKNRPENWMIDNQNWEMELVEVEPEKIYPPIKVVRVIA